VRHAVREQVAADAGGVTFEENLSEERKAAVLEGLDMVVLPSVAESFGIVVLEAWVHRKPVIVCDDSPPACTVKEVGGGVCYTYGYPDELAAAIDRLGTEPELRRALGERGYEAVREHYTWDAIADKFRDQCNRAVLQAGRTKRP
jgi:glycosyltransferase involved in cell wall biosynthesis